MTLPLSRATLGARHRVTGDLKFDTALHLGGGRNPAKGTDSPIIRDGLGQPFIPGSSIKGAVRAAVERIVPNLGISACGLYNTGESCPSALPESNELMQHLRKIVENLGQPIRKGSDLEKALVAVLQHKGKSLQNLPDPKNMTEENWLYILDLYLCQVCKTFGSSFIASTLFFHDAPVDREQWVGLTQVRDGVGIDRDSGRAVEGLKYDFETVPPDTVFKFSMTIETALNDPLGLGLAALVLHELVNGNVPLGGIRSRGLGRCHLDKDKTFVESLNLGDMEALKKYLKAEKLQPVQVNDFIAKHIASLWEQKENGHVQTPAQ